METPVSQEPGFFHAEVHVTMKDRSGDSAMQPFTRNVITQMVRLDDGSEVPHADLLGEVEGIRNRTPEEPMTIYNEAIAKFLVGLGVAQLVDANRYSCIDETRRAELEAEVRGLKFEP